MDNDSFLTRWSRRKLEDDPEAISDLEDEMSSEADADSAITESTSQLTENDVTDDNPENQSIASLLASQATKEIKKAALRKLFLSGEFSEVDRLNDYDHDYSSIKPLASEVAQKLREWMSEPVETESDEQEPLLTEHAEYDETSGAELLSEPNSNETKNTT